MEGLIAIIIANLVLCTKMNSCTIEVSTQFARTPENYEKQLADVLNETKTVSETKINVVALMYKIIGMFRKTLQLTTCMIYLKDEDH